MFINTARQYSNNSNFYQESPLQDRNLKNLFNSDKRVNKLAQYYRIISIITSSILFFIVEIPEIVWETKIVVFSVFLPLACILFVLYGRYKGMLRAVKPLIVLETFMTAFLLCVMGGFEGPFFWYALNPLICASIYFRATYAWQIMGIFFFSVVFRDVISHRDVPAVLIFAAEVEHVLSLGLLTLVIQLIFKFYFTLVEQAYTLEQPQDELFSVNQNLAESQYVFQSLSNFQRETISCKREEEIYLALITASESALPLYGSSVLVLEEPVPPSAASLECPYRVIRGEDEKEEFSFIILKELRSRWQEFLDSKIMIGENHNWVSMQLKDSNGRIMAVFLGFCRPQKNIYMIPKILPLFLSFTEQVVQRVRSLKQTEKTLDHLSLLYQAVETISSRDEPRKIIEVFAVYAKNLTGCEKIIFWIDPFKDDCLDEQEREAYYYTVKGKKSDFDEEAWYSSLLLAWSQMRFDPRPFTEKIKDPSSGHEGELICVPVKTHSECLGLLAAVKLGTFYRTEEIVQTLAFLADLSAVTIERNMGEVFADRLLIIEEQNRIANEIHDSISQNLFSIVYAVEALTRGNEKLPPEVRSSLKVVRDVAARTAKELRILIYRLSPRQKENKFVLEIKSYLEEMEKLNNINISLDIRGQEEYLNPATCWSFYRILKEATGNAVRHGKCTEIKVKLEITPFVTKMKISDNGKGFAVSDITKKRKSQGKLGLFNMQELMGNLRGELEITSSPGQGTCVTCSVPTSPISGGRVPKNHVKGVGSK